MNDPKIVLLAGKGTSTNILYNALKNKFNITTVIIEEPVKKKVFIKKRIKKLGIGKVIGQIFFQLIVVKWLDLICIKRKKEILQQYQLDVSEIPLQKITSVQSVNDDRCLDVLQSLQPGIVIVNGTRIISRKILHNISAVFINMHVGITPKYRGVHGGYWALANNDAGNFGVTIHLVDPGIDTGFILYQQRITPSSKDNFVTYPLLQLAHGIDYLQKAIEDALQNQLVVKKGSSETTLWSHPTIWQYIYYRMRKGIK